MWGAQAPTRRKYLLPILANARTTAINKAGVARQFYRQNEPSQSLRLPMVALLQVYPTCLIKD